MNSSKWIFLSRKSPNLLGRHSELAQINKLLNTPQTSHCLFVIGGGGLGKTRLLEEIISISKAGGSNFLVGSIIDLYHAETRSSIEVERRIVDELDPEQGSFLDYRQKYAQYISLQEHGAEPSVLEITRDHLHQAFINDYNQIAHSIAKAILCFDTIENLQYSGLDIENLLDLEELYPRLRTWLLNTLPRLENTLIVLAGRQFPDVWPKWFNTLQSAFGNRLSWMELQPFSLAETQDLIQEIGDVNDLLIPERIPVVHRLTRGRPIFIYLFTDLVRILSPNPQALLARLDEHKWIMECAENDPALEPIRLEFETEILTNVLNLGELANYISHLAFLPNGFNQTILENLFDLNAEEAIDVIVQLENLSFVKYHSMSGFDEGGDKRFFFHDEFYRLMRSPIIPHVKLTERLIAQKIIDTYYNPEISSLEVELSNIIGSSHSGVTRRRLEFFQVERLYYLLVRDPRLGYLEYKHLSDESNRRRNIEFGMQVLDEFYDYYNQLPSREHFKNAEIDNKQLICESIVKWVERLHWWAFYKEEISFVEKIFSGKDDIGYSVDEPALRGNIIALWVRAVTMTKGYDAGKVRQAIDILNLLPNPMDCNPQELLARGRLCTTIGYADRRAGKLKEAVKYNTEAISAFRNLPEYTDELAIVLNNQANIYASQGRIPLARIFGQEGLQINWKMRYEYALGLSMLSLAIVERVAGNYGKSTSYSNEGLDIFRSLNDPYGILRAYYNLGETQRKAAKRDLNGAWKKNNVLLLLYQAHGFIEKGIEITKNAELKAEIPGLQVVLGRIQRDIGRALLLTGKIMEANANFDNSVNWFTKSLQANLSVLDRCDLLHDIAELYFIRGDFDQSKKYLEQAENYFQRENQVKPIDCLTQTDFPSELFWILGKIQGLYGEISFKEGDFQAGMRDFVNVYVYYDHFSKSAIEKGQLVESLAIYLADMTNSERIQQIKNLDKWILENSGCIGGTVLDEFLEDIRALVG